ncbi:unnamed protein product [Ceratitis capitata]|uniref:(Mediterranean fruit fly) hypothetical protein n=1 Tax=Ceratitis capitata TaxID=7213 RepID=A0A811V9V2_CERCA|nr:unnamed protein product [Ceratitis capitata]
MRFLMQLHLWLCGLSCAMELARAAPIITAGFGYRAPYYPPPFGLPYYHNSAPLPPLYPSNPYPLGYSYGYGFGSFSSTPFIF